MEINANYDNTPIRIRAFTRYPSGNIKLYTKSRAEARWLLENRARWTHRADPLFVTSPPTFPIIIHSCPTYVDIDDEICRNSLLQQNDIKSEQVDRIRWLGHPKEEEKSHGSLVIYFTDKALAYQILRGGLIFDGNFMRTMTYTQGPPQCFNCLKTGHMAFQCKENPTCSNCGGSHLPQDCKDPGYPPSIKRCPMANNTQIENISLRPSHKEDFPLGNNRTVDQPTHLATSVTPELAQNHPHCQSKEQRRKTPGLHIHQQTNSCTPNHKSHTRKQPAFSHHAIRNLRNNPPSTFDGIDLLDRWLQSESTRQTPTFVMMDSNLHHPHWNPIGYTHTHTQARNLIKVCGRKGFGLISPRHTPTFLGSVGKPTAIDLTGANHKSRLLQAMTQVQLNNHSSDHHPIITKITLPQSPPLPPPRHPAMRLNQLNSNLFLDHLRQLLSATADITKTSHLNTAGKTAQDLSTAIMTAYNNQGKWVTTNPTRAKAWWDKSQLDELVKLRNRARQEMLKHQTNEAKEAYHYHQQKFKQKVWELKSSHWRKFLAEKGPDHAYCAYKFTKDRQSLADLWDIPCQRPPRLPPEFPPVTEEEVMRTISSLPNRKAPGPDGIPNELIKIAKTLLTPPLTCIFNMCLRQGLFPTHWKNSCTAIIRKAAKDDYTNPNAYRPIALLNTLGKLFEKIINTRLNYWAYTTKAIHPGHVGGTPGRSINDAFIALTSWINHKWREGKVVMGMFLD
ncbi:hypothetical protein O181_025903, partial [Austropuccinia psidii MF-1]|nr:hypothetical protein [Austropuccinia psidii MF-1]